MNILVQCIPMKADTPAAHFHLVQLLHRCGAAVEFVDCHILCVLGARRRPDLLHLEANENDIIFNRRVTPERVDFPDNRVKHVGQA